MKKGGLVLNVILLIAVAVLFYLHFNSNKGNSNNTVTKIENTTPGTVSNTIENMVNEADSLTKFFAIDSNIIAKPIKIAYVDGDSLDSNLKLLEDVKKKINAKQSDIKRRILAKEKIYETEFKQKYETWGKLSRKLTIKAPSLTETQFKEEQGKLYKLQEELQYLKPYYQQKLMEYSQVLEGEYIELKSLEMKNYFKKVQTYCKSIAKSKGFDFILMYQRGGQILYSNEAYNISNYVISAINKEYDSKNKK